MKSALFWGITLRIEIKKERGATSLISWP